MSTYTAYDTTTGQILAVGMCGDGDEAYQYTAAGSAILIDAYGDRDTEYVLAGVLTDRPSVTTSLDTTHIQADGFDAATIIGVPAGWSYKISNGASGTTDGTDVVLTALEAGSYTITFSLWPYQDIEYTIYASAAPL